MAAAIARTASSTQPDDLHRQSTAAGLTSPSPASFLTASQASALSLTPSRSSSTHTAAQRDVDAPLHAIALAATAKPPQEMHVVRVTEEHVSLDSGIITETVLHKVGASLPGHRLHHASDSTDSNFGPPPPSPPSSTENDDGDGPSRFVSSKPEPPSRPVTFEDPMRAHNFPRYSSRSHYSSTETKSSQHSTVSPTNQTGSLETPRTESTSVDGYLSPPLATPHKPSRRNTTGSGPSPPSPQGQAAARMRTIHGHAPSSFTFEDAELGGELASDIQQQAEQIRRERLSKRAKQQQEADRAKAQQDAERALTRTQSFGRDRPMVGNLIGEDHVNYVLMYNMLTGIRIAVSRCQAKIRRPLTDEDYTARHKFSFDIVGNELTPSAKYDFKFKDYAPWVFRELREDYFQLDPADYLLSLTAKYILSELGSPGKSGSFFYFSVDYRFIIKTIHASEHRFLRSILPQYYQHVKNNPHTLLSRFYGLHRVKLPHGRKIHFVIMNNLFPAHRDIHETYDLKGSTVGREYPEEKAKANPRATLKDLNWINRGKELEVGPEKRALFTEQLRRDSEFLKQVFVMDYSLLVGIHNMQRGNRDNVRSNTLKVFSPDMSPIRRKPTQGKGATSPDAIALRRIMRASDPQRLGAGTVRLPEEDPGERAHFLFYQDEGGLRATDEANGLLDTIYYLGVIDILTPYTTRKKLEHFWKGLSADRHKISPVPPHEYGDRFFEFMKAIMRGGGGGGRFKSE